MLVGVLATADDNVDVFIFPNLSSTLVVTMFLIAFKKEPLNKVWVVVQMLLV